MPINGGKHMTQKNSTNTHVTVNPNHRPMIYYPIDDDDYESTDFYKNNGCAVRKITLNGKPHRFALVPAQTQKQADCINREFSYLPQKMDIKTPTSNDQCQNA